MRLRYVVEDRVVARMEDNGDEVTITSGPESLRGKSYTRVEAARAAIEETLGLTKKGKVGRTRYRWVEGDGAYCQERWWCANPSGKIVAEIVYDGPFKIAFGPGAGERYVSLAAAKRRVKRGLTGGE